MAFFKNYNFRPYQTEERKQKHYIVEFKSCLVATSNNGKY